MPSSSPSATRPPSRASVRRPTSNTSTQLSQRNPSRHSHRAPTRSWTQTLVAQVTGLPEDPQDVKFNDAVHAVSKHIDFLKAAPLWDMSSADTRVHGYVQKARIQSHDSFAESLEKCYTELKKSTTTWNRDQIETLRLPEHLQFLVLMSLPPEVATLEIADGILARLSKPPSKHSELTWERILTDEPFEGEHWRGVYGLNPDHIRPPEDEDQSGSDSAISLSSSLSDASDSDLDFLSPNVSKSLNEFSFSSKGPPSSLQLTPVQYLQLHQQDIEDLQSSQYWRPEAQRMPLCTTFDLGKPSTLGPSFARAISQGVSSVITDAHIQQEQTVNDLDAVRETLIGLQGRKTILFASRYDTDGRWKAIEPISSAPRLQHLTLGAQTSILLAFAALATVLVKLRTFAGAILHNRTPTVRTEDHRIHLRLSNYSRDRCRTLEAFADATRRQVHMFEKWCAEKEEELSLSQAGAGPPYVASLLSLNKAIQDTVSGAFVDLLEIVDITLSNAFSCSFTDLNPENEVPGRQEFRSRLIPSALSTLILDSLVESIYSRNSIGDVVAARTLMKIFNDSVEPVWRMAGNWVRNGVVHTVDTPPNGVSDSLTQPISEPEFFIRDNFVSLLDPSFWAEGHTLCRKDSVNSAELTVPRVFTSVADLILGAGKAMGLLRTLGATATNTPVDGILSWTPFREIIPTQSKSAFSADRSDELLREALQSFCLAAPRRLRAVLIDECDLLRHLTAIEDVFLMRRGDAMSHFCDALFALMDTRQPWSDFHNLNTAFRVVSESTAAAWIQPSLVRFFYRGVAGRDRTINRTTHALDGLMVEYQLPIPLTYFCGPDAFETYNSVFVFLLKIRRAKATLDQILMRQTLKVHDNGTGNKIKAFYAMRSQLSWFVNVLLNFVATNVLQPQIMAFHTGLKQSQTLDDMIELHRDHLSKIKSRCFLQQNTFAVHRAIISILDMCLRFASCFNEAVGNVAHDISRQSIILKRSHRSRRQRQTRRNTIGFSLQSPDSDESDAEDDDGDLDERNTAVEREDELSLNVSHPVEASSIDVLSAEIGKMCIDLDGLVRFVRRSVESLAGNAGEAATAFGVLAFALEDWDV